MGPEVASEQPLSIITGASRGIGYAIAAELARRGHRLALLARSPEALERAAGRLSASAPAVRAFACDVRESSQVGAVFQEVLRWGGRVDVLVNNAGMAGSGLFQDQTAAEVRGMVQLNMRAVVELTHRLLPGMIERGRGRILNVASITAFQPVPGLSLYSATKAFVLSFSESLSEDLRGTGVTVTALCPGLTRTDMVSELPAQAIAEPFMADAREVALSGYRACMAGEVIRVPGVLNQAMVNWVQYQPRWLVRMFSGMLSRSAWRQGE